MVKEQCFYKNIAIWLEKKGYYVGRVNPKKYDMKELYIKKGLKKSQADVIGIRNIGDSYIDEIEIAIIEVKHSNNQRPIKIQELEQKEDTRTMLI